ncbi:hypothetical protein ABZS66_19290 [Dactylosporangium sp. NPDC005572]|uniref:hypothetical protein n=1 Tax=Dactylosporangium sp. NPDC005572 TaxID=3156889 RepID=UPI0033BE3569
MSMLRNLWARFGRATVAVAIAGLTVLASALTDGRVDPGEQLQIAIQTVTVFGVWFVPNLPHSAAYKTGVAALLAVLNLATTVIIGGVDSAEVVNLVLAALGVLGVGVTPSISRAESLVPRPVAAAASRATYGGS